MPAVPQGAASKYVAMEATRDGRALPPRPTLLVGDEEQCKAAWARVEPEARGLLAQLPPWRTTAQWEAETASAQAADAAAAATAQQQQAPGVSGASSRSGSGRIGAQAPLVPDQPKLLESLAHMVARLRSLRESLVSNYLSHTPLALQVYELSCDVAAAAGRGAAPELLKALHGLVGDGGLEAAVYEPALSQGSGTAGGGGAGEEAGADSAAAGSSAVGTPGTGQGAGSTLAAGSSTRSTSEERVSPLAHASARAAEMAAAHVLFFACVPTQTDKGELVALLRAKPPKGVLAHWGSPEVTYSMQVVRAVAAGDFVSFFRLRWAGPPTRTTAAGAASPSAASTSAAWGSVDAAPCGPEGMGEGGAAGAAASSSRPSCSRLLQELMDHRLGQMRQLAVRALAATYRTLPMRAALPLLGLPGPVPAGSSLASVPGSQGPTQSTASQAQAPVEALLVASMETGSSRQGQGRGLGLGQGTADSWWDAEEGSGMGSTGRSISTSKSQNGVSGSGSAQGGSVGQGGPSSPEPGVLTDPAVGRTLLALLGSAAAGGCKGAGVALGAVQKALGEAGGAGTAAVVRELVWKA